MYISEFADLLISAVAVIIALTVHEFFHAFIAYKLGDPTSASLGRLTLNPLRHLDPIGAICLLVFHFGWAKPVPINARYFNKPKRDFAFTALAGPLSNIIVAFFSGMLYVLLYKLQGTVEQPQLQRIVFVSTYFFYVFFAMNVGLGVFNLIPIPPLDGSRILNAILPEKTYFRIMKYEKNVYRVFVAWLLLGTPIYNMLSSLQFISQNQVLLKALKILSLGQLISEAISDLAVLIIKFWTFCFY